MSDIQKLRVKAWDAIEFDENASVDPDDLLALLARIESAEKALKVYGETCDYDDGSETSCRYEPHMCCKSARAHLSQYGERT